jgi:hypothetical protein
MAIALFGGKGTVPWTGWIYLLIFPLQIVNGRVMDSRRRNEGTRTAAGTNTDSKRP